MLDIDFLLANGATYKKIPKGNYVFQEGSVCTFYYQLLEGRVKWVNASDGRDFIQSLIEPGESFGELPLFDELPYAASAMAESDSLVIRLPKATFQQIIRDQPDILYRFCQLMVKRLRFKFLTLKEMACYDPEHQVMTLIDQFKSIRNEEQGRCRINLTRQQIADMTGLRVETVIRVVKKLEQSGKVTIEKGKVYVPQS